MDTSLDDMIKAAPKAGRGGGGGRGDGGGRGPKKAGGRGGGNSGVAVRSKVIAKPRRGPTGGRAVAMAVDDRDRRGGGGGGGGGNWGLDMFEGGGRGGISTRPGSGGRDAGGGKLIISNLHFSVSNMDIKASRG